MVVQSCPVCAQPVPRLRDEDPFVNFYRCPDCQVTWATSKETDRIVTHVPLTASTKPHSLHP